MRNSCAILGSSWSYIAVISDVIFDTYGVTDFHIYKNVAVDGVPLVDATSSPCNFNVFEPNQFNKIKGDLIVFGVSWPNAKVFVFRDFTINASLRHDNLTTIIHPNAYLSKSVKYASGLFVEPGVVISSQTTIGFSVTIKRNCSIGHHNLIGDFCDLSPGITTASHVTIGKGCIISTGCIIGRGVTIGENVHLGMGSVVTKDIPSGVIAYGNPCKVIRANDQWNI